jgi:hypothetical protein
MQKLNEQGSLILPLVIVVVLLVGALGFGGWAYTSRQDYKDNVDEKIAEAVEASNEQLSIEKDAEFAEREKSPLRNYLGPSALGSVSVVYPKTWSAFIDEGAGGKAELNAYFHPDFVPPEESEVSFALRLEVVNQTYDQVIKSYDSKVKTAKITATAYRAPKVTSELGVQLRGEIDSKKQGVLVLLPARDKTIKIWTEGQNFVNDFNAVLDSLTYIP